MWNVSQNELNQITTMYDQSRDDVEQIAKMRRIKNYEAMLKEELIISLLKSKLSIAELFKNNFDKISDIKRVLNRLRDILPRKYREEIKKNFKIQKIRKIFQNQKKKRFMTILLNQEEFLIKKKEHGYHDRDDLDYNGLRDIENLFSKVAEEDYYKPILVKSSFKRSYKYYESRRDGNKNLSAKQYLSGL